MPGLRTQIVTAELQFNFGRPSSTRSEMRRIRLAGTKDGQAAGQLAVLAAEWLVSDAALAQLRASSTSSRGPGVSCSIESKQRAATRIRDLTLGIAISS